MTTAEIANSIPAALSSVNRAIKQLRTEDAQGGTRRIYVSRLTVKESRGGAATTTWALGDFPDANDVDIVAQTIGGEYVPNEIAWTERNREEARQENTRHLNAHLRALAGTSGNPFASLIWQATQ